MQELAVTMSAFVLQQQMRHLILIAFTIAYLSKMDATAIQVASDDILKNEYHINPRGDLYPVKKGKMRKRN